MSQEEVWSWQTLCGYLFWWPTCSKPCWVTHYWNTSLCTRAQRMRGAFCVQAHTFYQSVMLLMRAQLEWSWQLVKPVYKQTKCIRMFATVVQAKNVGHNLQLHLLSLLRFLVIPCMTVACCRFRNTFMMIVKAPCPISCIVTYFLKQGLNHWDLTKDFFIVMQLQDLLSIGTVWLKLWQFQKIKGIFFLHTSLVWD